MLSFEARERRGALLRQGCSRATCSAVSRAYAQIAPLRTATSGAAVARRLDPTRSRRRSRQRGARERTWSNQSNSGPQTTVSPLPRWEGGIRASVLGGHNLVISAFSSNPEAAVKLVDYLTGTEIVTQDATDFSLAPALQVVWDDPAVQRALPAFEDLQDAIRTAKARPVVPNYLAVSRATYTNVNAALQGEVSPEDALDAANDQVQLALDAAARPGLVLAR